MESIDFPLNSATKLNRTKFNFVARDRQKKYILWEIGRSAQFGGKIRWQFNFVTDPMNYGKSKNLPIV
jgi:hypothetical protein